MPHDRPRLTAVLDETSTMLWLERHLLDVLRFKLEVQHVMLTRDQTQWVAYATREIVSMAEELERVAIERSRVVARAGAALGAPPRAPLRAIAGCAPAPWAGILDEHRVVSGRLIAGVLATAVRLTELLERGPAMRTLDLDSPRVGPGTRAGQRTVAPPETSDGAPAGAAGSLAVSTALLTELDILTYDDAAAALARLVGASTCAFYA